MAKKLGFMIDCKLKHLPLQKVILLIVGANNRTSNVITGTKNLTVIIKFDSKGIVEDFNVRSGGY
jgi:hypothetical protein